MPLPAIALGLSIGSTLLGLRSSSKARKREKSAQALQQKRSAIINVRNRRAAMASLRRQQAMRQASSISTGMAGGSGDRATRSSVESQGLAGIAFHDRQVELGADASAHQTAANRYSNQAQTYGALSGLIGQVGQMAAASTPLVQPVVQGITPSLPSGN